MSYESAESSVADGRPIELYDFACGTEHWRYTSCSEGVTYQSVEYAPVAIQRSELEIAENPFRNELAVTVGRSNPFAVQFIAAPLEGIVELTVCRGHGTDFVTFFKGVVSSISFNSDGAIIRATPRTTGLQRVGLRRKYQKLCNHPLYGAGCGVNAESFKVTGTITVVSGLDISSTVLGSKADGWFTAGKIIVGNARRLITAHTGNTVTVSARIADVAAGNSFTAYAGCDHATATCRDKFANLDNYGGQPFIPTKNPFSGDAIL